MRAVSFDFDNTLLLSEHLKHDTIAEIAKKFPSGTDVLTTVHTDSRTAPKGVLVTRNTIFRDLAHGIVQRGEAPPGMDAVSLGESLCEQFTTLLEQRLVQAEHVPGTIAMLQHLKSHGVPCYVNTATPQEPIDLLVDALGWRQYFRRVFGAPATKVDNLRSIAKAEGGIDPTSMVHVGDGANDHRAASEFGCPFIGVHLPGKEHPAFERSEAIVSNMTEAVTVLCRLALIPAPGKKPDGASEGERMHDDLPSLPAPRDDAPTTLDVSTGQSVALDHLGPIVVNRDGSISRISNWDKMTEAEQESTKRRIAKRNVERLKELDQGGGSGKIVSALKPSCKE